MSRAVDLIALAVLRSSVERAAVFSKDKDWAGARAAVESLEASLRQPAEEDRRLRVRIKLEALVSEREGMIAFNKQREFSGRAMGYVDADFTANAEDMRELLKELEGEAVLPLPPAVLGGGK